MEWIDIAKIIVAVVLFENMGMRTAIEKVTGYNFKVLSCTRCTTFWSILFYISLYEATIIDAISFSFIGSYIAVWCELLFGYLTLIYERIYKKITIFTDNLKSN